MTQYSASFVVGTTDIVPVLHYTPRYEHVWRQYIVTRLTWVVQLYTSYAQDWVGLHTVAMGKSAASPVTVLTELCGLPLSAGRSKQRLSS
jgi:hypothetical protein